MAFRLQLRQLSDFNGNAAALLAAALIEQRIDIRPLLAFTTGGIRGFLFARDWRLDVGRFRLNS